jgi:hypothetical protein
MKSRTVISEYNLYSNISQIMNMNNTTVSLHEQELFTLPEHTSF